MEHTVLSGVSGPRLAGSSEAFLPHGGSLGPGLFAVAQIFSGTKITNITRFAVRSYLGYLKHLLATFGQLCKSELLWSLQILAIGVVIRFLAQRAALLYRFSPNWLTT